MSPLVKICGITNPHDAVAAVSAGASAIGLVFWPGSPRCVDAARAREIVTALPPFVSAVGVFVNQVEDAAQIARERRVILAGGLSAENVAEAIAAVNPYAIDVSSGVESAPGRKDPAKLRALFAAL